MNKVITLAEAKSHLSALDHEAEEGAEITITRHGRPVARIVGAPRDVDANPWRLGMAGDLRQICIRANDGRASA